MPTVNLDALISREDFEINEDTIQSQTLQTLQIRDLEQDSFFFNVLRKPDFQRESSDWQSEKIGDFVENFLDGDLIPAIILWNSGKFIFVIDGAHRLSALIAWVRADYGDGVISKSFFGHCIPDEQIRIAEKTRKLVKRTVGTYYEHRYAIQNQETSPKDLLEGVKRLASLALQLQWVKGDADKAENSFFKINQQAAPIGKTELRLLQSRNKPNSLAARAIMRSGTGHKYWSKFTEEKQENVESIAKEINNMLFTPPLKTPVKTLDLPVAGHGYSAQTLTLILDLVNSANNVKSENELEEDSDGDDTIKSLNSTRRIVQRISCTHPASLGLHPAVYFYSPQGRYQPTALLAMVELIKEFDKRDYYRTFTDNRRNFENFILKYKTFVQQVNYKRGSGIKGSKHLQELYQFILEYLESGKTEEEIIDSLKNDERFSFLKTEEMFPTETNKSDFSSRTKSATFLIEALKNPLRCKICGGLIHINSISIDHITRKEDGGLGTIDNAQLTHLYCSTTYKN